MYIIAKVLSVFFFAQLAFYFSGHSIQLMNRREFIKISSDEMNSQYNTGNKSPVIIGYESVSSPIPSENLLTYVKHRIGPITVKTIVRVTLLTLVFNLIKWISELLRLIITSSIYFGEF